MTEEALRQHLRDDHGFDAADTVSRVPFLAGVHHGFHVEAGRHGAEDHAHELALA